ncbi:MAG: alpha/beta fold hydrolase [Thermomicrobiales bacterium]
MAATDIASPIASPAEGSPVASPEAVESADAALFPDNALGQQAAWTWSLLTNGGVAVDASEIEAHVAPSLLAVASADQIATGLVQLQEMYGPFTLEPDSMIMTANEPPTTMRYSIVGANGEHFNVSLKIDPETELLTGFLVSPAAPAATPEAADLPSGLTDTQVSFTSGADTIYGSIMAPASFSTSDSSPAALIISGSGATDRDGVSSGLPLGTNRNLAITLAEAGIPSLRYDKLGSGQTGLGSHADPSSVDYQLFLQEASDAAAYLAEQPGVDPTRLIIVGHSEGALFALALADELTKAGTPPAGLILVAPLSVRYLDLITDQMTTQLKAAVDGGSMTEADATALADELAAIVESLRTTGELPETIGSPQLAALFNPESTAFLSQIDQIDPGALAAGLPSDIPVLVLLGAKDAQITGDQVRHLLDGLSEAGNSSVTFVALPKADHSLRIIEGEANPAVDYANPDLEFSPDAVAAIDAFLVKYGLEPGA